MINLAKLFKGFSNQLVKGCPNQLSQLDFIGHKLLVQKVDYSTPEYQDPEYMERKAYITAMAKLHRMGQPIREVDYT